MTTNNSSSGEKPPQASGVGVDVTGTRQGAWPQHQLVMPGTGGGGVASASGDKYGMSLVSAAAASSLFTASVLAVSAANNALKPNASTPTINPAMVQPQLFQPFVDR